MASRRPRRTRFTATVSQPGSMRTEEKAFLGYGEADTRAYYEQRGYTVRRIRKGDFVNCAYQGGWRTSLSLINQATRQLGIEWPVKIKQTSSHGGQQGCHRIDYTQGKPYHSITVKSYLSVERAGEVLWHELRHAQQSEALAEETGAMPGTEEYVTAYKHAYRGIRPGSDRKRGTRYKTRSWEVEASETEQRNATTPLAVSAR